MRYPPREPLGGNTADDDLVGQMVTLDLDTLATAVIVKNDKTAQKLYLRGDWTGLLAVDKFIKVHPRESTIGNTSLFVGESGYVYDGGSVTINGTDYYRLPTFYYVHNRYYAPEWGRWIQRDPIGIWQDAPNLGNGYTYTANNPATLTDPSGLREQTAADKAAIARGEARLSALWKNVVRGMRNPNPGFPELAAYKKYRNEVSSYRKAVARAGSDERIEKGPIGKWRPAGRDPAAPPLVGTGIALRIQLTDSVDDGGTYAAPVSGTQRNSLEAAIDSIIAKADAAGMPIKKLVLITHGTGTAKGRMSQQVGGNIQLSSFSKFYEQEFRRLRGYLANGAQIELRVCRVAGNNEGIDLMKDILRATGAKTIRGAVGYLPVGGDAYWWREVTIYPFPPLPPSWGTPWVKGDPDWLDRLAILLRGGEKPN